MKSLIGLVSVLLTLFVISSEATAQSIIPPLKLDDFTLKLTGTSRSTASSEVLTNGKHFDWNLLRLRLDVETPDPKIKMFAEVEAMNSDEPESNWLRMAYTSYQIDERWVVRAGRLFLAGPYYSTPPFFLLETAHFPREPWGYYAYGVQTEGTFGDGWSLITDMSGRSNVSFDQSENFDRLETSGRLEKQLTKTLGAGVLYQVSQDFVRGGADFHYASNAFGLYGEVYAARENDTDIYGGYILGRYELSRNVVPHLQFDFQHTDVGGSDIIITPGVMFRTGNESVRFIVDYEWHVNEPEQNGVYGVLQFRF